MNGLIADANFIGHLERLVAVLDSPELAPFWDDLALPVQSCEALELDHAADDRMVWNRCQALRLVLLTGNRNHDGPNSLEAVIRGGAADSLPVFTVSDPTRLLHEPTYARHVAIDLLDYLFDLRDQPEKLLGTGRLYLPKKSI
jgi:hypothetical protein